MSPSKQLQGIFYAEKDVIPPIIRTSETHHGRIDDVGKSFEKAKQMDGLYLPHFCLQYLRQSQYHDTQYEDRRLLS